MADKEENVKEDPVDIQENHDESHEVTNGDDNTAENEDSVSQSEIDAINAQLDKISIVLDVLENKNDSIHAGLIELLNSNREARKQFQESLRNQGNDNENKST